MLQRGHGLRGTGEAAEGAGVAVALLGQSSVAGGDVTLAMPARKVEFDPNLPDETDKPVDSPLKHPRTGSTKSAKQARRRAKLLFLSNMRYSDQSPDQFVGSKSRSQSPPSDSDSEGQPPLVESSSS